MFLKNRKLEKLINDANANYLRIAQLRRMLAQRVEKYPPEMLSLIRTVLYMRSVKAMGLDSEIRIYTS